jgi:hypothetical protein
MISRLLFTLCAAFSLVLAGFWPAFVDKALLNARQVIGAVPEETTAAAAGTEETTQAAQNGAGQAAGQQATTQPTTQRTQAAAGAANPATVATTPTTAATPAAATPAGAAETEDTETTAAATPPAVAPVAPAAPAAPAAAPPAADPADFEIPYTMQTGTIRYAPMPPKVGSKITNKNPTPLYPTSDYTPFVTKAGAASVDVTVTAPFTWSTQSSEAVSTLSVSVRELTDRETEHSRRIAANRRYAEVPKSMEGLTSCMIYVALRWRWLVCWTRS